MEELKAAVAKVQAMEMSMIDILNKIENTDKYLVHTLSKFTLISTFLIGVMTMHLTLFGVWAFYVSNQNMFIEETILTNRNTSEQRDARLQASINNMAKEQQALIESTAENNYNITGHNSESEINSEKINTTLEKLYSILKIKKHK